MAGALALFDSNGPAVSVCISPRRRRRRRRHGYGCSDTEVAAATLDT
jgi:hypothetical protein